MHRFTIQRKISDTLLGATYECSFNATTTTARPTTVAVKCSSLVTRKRLQDTVTASLDDPQQERRVVAALMASGGHDNVLQCFDHFVTHMADDNGPHQLDGDDGHEKDAVVVCVVTEFCNDGDLFSHLTASSTQGIGERDAVSLMLQVARGVLFLQSRLGFAHRDLSLENVLLHDGVCKLADFGLTTAVGERCRDCVGKQYYMAPEVTTVPAQGYDPASADVWSLGVMLFMLLTGSPLVDKASRMDPGFVAVTRRGVGAILAAWGVQASTELVALMGAMLQAEPAERPAVVEIVGRLSHLVERERQSCL